MKSTPQKGMHHMPDIRVHRPLWIFGGLAALCSVPVSGAETAPAGDTGGPLQEITVTATRREESLSKVPISVTALTQDAMDLPGCLTPLYSWIRVPACP
jgi:hypothetical protein